MNAPGTLPLAAALKAGTALWYFSRGTGVVALLLLTATVSLGILESMRWAPRPWPKFSTVVLHRNLSLLALSLIVLHVAAIVLDGFAPIGWKDAIVPLASPYRPLWVGLGALAVDIQLALLATSLLRRHLSFRTWRVAHWLAYACWPVALLHGLGSGTDTRLRWMLLLDVVCVLVVVALLLRRLSVGWPKAVEARILGATAAVVVPLLVGVWVVREPLQPGWAEKAGTPVSLLASSSGAAAPAAGPTPAPSAKGLPAPPFQASLRGTLHQRGFESGGPSTVTIEAVLSGQANGRLRIILRGQALDGGGVVVQRSQVALGGPSGAALYVGPVGTLDGTHIAARLQGVGRPPLWISIDLQLDPSSSGVRGTLEASATS